MLTAEDTHSIADEVISAFEQVIEREPGTVRDFVHVFNKREGFPGLPEARGNNEGLAEVLAGLLASAFRVKTPPQGASQVQLPKEFVQNMKAVMSRLPKQHPVALLMFKKHLLTYHCDAGQGLATLLRKYAAEEAACPY